MFLGGRLDQGSGSRALQSLHVLQMSRLFFRQQGRDPVDERWAGEFTGKAFHAVKARHAPGVQIELGEPGGLRAHRPPEGREDRAMTIAPCDSLNLGLSLLLGLRLLLVTTRAGWGGGHGADSAAQDQEAGATRHGATRF